MATTTSFVLHPGLTGQLEGISFGARDFSHYLFGNTRIARRYGMQLAQRFIQEALPDQIDPCIDTVVLYENGHLPSASNELRNQFTYHLNRHLISHHVNAAEKMELCANGRLQEGSCLCGETTEAKLHTNRGRFERKRCIFVDDIKGSEHSEAEVRRVLVESNAASIHFVYFASTTQKEQGNDVAERLAKTTIKSLKDLDPLIYGSSLSLTTRFASFVLDAPHETFCQFLRRQEDDFVHRLLDVAISAGLHKGASSERNMGFLMWDVQARESLNLTDAF